MDWSRPMGAWLAPLLLLAAAVFAILFDPFGMETSLSSRLFDAYQRNFPAVYSESTQTPVRALEIDSDSLAKNGPWPWDEEKLAGLTASLYAAGAKLLVFAVPLETVEAGPEDILAKLPPGPNFDAARNALNALPDPDALLAARFREQKTVVPVTLGVAGGREPDVKAHFVFRGEYDPYRAAPAFDSAAASTEKLEQAAIGIGGRNLIPDPDGIVRRMPLVFRLNGKPIPALDAEALRVLQNHTDITVVTDERDPVTFVRGVGIAGLQTDDHFIPTERDGAFRLHYSAGAPELFRAGALDGPEAGALRGAIVIIGPPGTQVKTPLGMMSEAGVLAEGLQDLLSGQVLHRPAYARIAEAVWLALFGVGAILLLLRFGLGWASGLALAGILITAYGSWYLYMGHGVLIDAASPSVGLVLVLAGAAIVNVRELRLKRASLRMAFSDSLPRATIEKIARRPSLLKTDGETRTVTYLVCGVRGLAGLAASFRDDPAGFTRMTSQVLTPLMDQALAHGGTIDRLTADGFAAFWNAPLADSDHATHACEAANGMSVMSSRVSEVLAQEHRPAGAPPLAAVEIGVGIATGNVIAGGFGGHGRVGYSVHGDTVNLAARIQALSPQYGPAVIVADDTRQLSDRSFAFLEVDYIAAGADDPPVRLYAMLGNPVVRASPKFRALATFHDHIFQALRQQRWAEARDLIGQCRQLSGASQKLYDLHLKRIAYFEANPPGENWDGAFRPILK